MSEELRTNGVEGMVDGDLGEQASKEAGRLSVFEALAEDLDEVTISRSNASTERSPDFDDQ